VSHPVRIVSVAMPLPLPTSLSPSKVASFKDCALAFRYSVIDRLPEPPSPAAAKGTLVHKALELLFAEEEPAGRTIEAALDKLDRAWVDVIERDDEYADLELDDAAAFRADAAERIRRYFELEDPAGVNPIGLELRLEASLGSLKLAGIIDRLELDADGGLVVTDYKTGRAPSVAFEQGRLGGVHFYAFLCEEALGRRPSRVQLLYLSDPPVAIVATPSDQSIRGMATRATAIWSAVERACEREDFRPRPGRLCDWCSFKAHCPAFAGAELVGAAATR
jgi:putative RecB family exonuclease